MKKYKHFMGNFYFYSDKEVIVQDNGTHFTVTIGKLISTQY